MPSSTELFVVVSRDKWGSSTDSVECVCTTRCKAEVEAKLMSKNDSKRDYLVEEAALIE